MLRSNEILREASVLSESSAGPVLEIKFSGRHQTGCGNEMIAYVQECVETWKPAAVLLNLADFKYRCGNDVGALLFPLYDGGSGQFRPYCVVSGKRSTKSLKSLFAMTFITELLEARYFDDAGEALEYLKKKLRGCTRENPSV